jgi:quinoprotein glucose dehydrogenase
VVTAGGLTFIGAADDGWLRAFETATGRLLWQARLPAAANATPMVATLPDGRQAIVVSAGGHTYLGTQRGDRVLAFALPEAR